MRRVTLAALAMASSGALAIGCTPAWQRSTYEQCLASPQSWGEGQIRRGELGVNGFLSGQYGSEDKSFTVSITRKDCLDTVDVRGRGVEFHGGPFRPMWDSAFAVSFETNRLAVAHYTDEHEAWVWLDGERHGPYDGIGIGPRFSRSGAHVAWAALEGSAQVLYVDGREVRRGQRLLDFPFFWVLDDGRVAAPLLRSDGKLQFLVGADYDSGPLDEHCSFVVGPRSRWAFTAKRDGQWITVIDGKELGVPGVPQNCDVRFSEDGAHFGYLNSTTFGAPRTWAGLVLDGSFIPLAEDASSFDFHGDLPVVKLDKKAGRDHTDWEATFVTVGVETPRAAPTADDYEPDRGYSPGRSWARVKIGDSVGPRFDRIKDLRRDERGRIRYVGLRHEAPHEVVDNVIVPVSATSVPPPDSPQRDPTAPPAGGPTIAR